MIALYVRVSTQEQAKEGYSIDEQSERLRKYAEASGWSDVKLFTDAGYSGASMDRPALQEMISEVRAGRIEKVIVYKLDRLSRSQLDTLYLIEKVFLASGCDFVSFSESFDTSTPFGKAMIGILAVFAQLEREQIKERMNMGRDARAKEGLFHGGVNTPYGYIYRDGELQIEPAEAVVVEDIYRMYIDGKSINRIIDELKARGIPSRKGSWSYKTVRGILTNKTYLGFIRYHDEWYQGTHEQIISESSYEAVRELLEAKRGKYTPKQSEAGRASHLLSGMVICGCCGAKYGITSERHHLKKDGSLSIEKRKYVCYSRSKVKKYLIKDAGCRNKIWIADELEGMILDEVKKLRLDSSEQIPESHLKSDSIRAEIDSLEKQMEKVIDLYTMDAIPRDRLEHRLHDIREKKERLEKALEQMADAEHRDRDKKRALMHLDSFSKAIEEGSQNDIRALLQLLIDKIVVDGDDISIYWNIP